MIRPATLADVETIGAIHVAGWGAAYRGILPDDYLAALSAEERAAGWRPGLERDARMLWVCEDAGKVVGWVALGKSREEDEIGAGELYALYVDPAHWHRGAGGALVRQAETELWERGFDSVALWVLERNHLGRTVYAKLGYAESGRTKALQIAGVALVELRLKKVRPSPGSLGSGSGETR